MTQKHLILFDVDGTLAPSAMDCGADIRAMLRELAALPNVHVGVVGGGTLEKISRQLGDHVSLLRFVFAENGLVTGDGAHHGSVRMEVPEDAIQRVVSSCLRWIADARIPFKRGKFIDFRDGLIYICPIGGQCSAEERAAFAAHDNEHDVRRALIAHLRSEGHRHFEFTLGGQIGIGAAPRGWNKTYCLRHVDASGEAYENIFFVGDRIGAEGNDYPLYASPRTIGFGTRGPSDTIRIVRERILPICVAQTPRQPTGAAT